MALKEGAHMGVWHAAFANLMRTRYSALVAYGELLVGEKTAARDLAERAVTAVFSRRLAPRDLREAELDAREWMATHAISEGADPSHVATVLMAIDGRSPEGVRQALGRATPEPLPEPRQHVLDELRRRFGGTAAVYATPSGGNNAILAPARSKRRSGVVGVAVGSVAGAVAVLAVGAAGYAYLPGLLPGSEPAASASPSPTLLAVTWNPGPETQAAAEGLALPECGALFAPEAQTVDGISAAPRIQVHNDDPDYGPWVSLTDGFSTEDKEQRQLLAQPGTYVMTLDDKVVYVSRLEEWSGELMTANAVMSHYYSGGFTRADLCDAREDADALMEEWGDTGSMSEDELEEYQDSWDAFYKKWSEFEPGTYKVYQVSAIVFGEQLAVAQVLALEGVGQLAYIEQDISWSDLAEDPLVAPYCTGSWDVGDWHCDPPADVLRELLTRDVDPATIDDTAAGVAISAPLEYVVD